MDNSDMGDPCLHRQMCVRGFQGPYTRQSQWTVP